MTTNHVQLCRRPELCDEHSFDSKPNAVPPWSARRPPFLLLSSFAKYYKELPVLIQNCLHTWTVHELHSLEDIPKSSEHLATEVCWGRSCLVQTRLVWRHGTFPPLVLDSAVHSNHEHHHLVPLQPLDCRWSWWRPTRGRLESCVSLR